MDIIRNIDSANCHYKEVADMIKDADELLIASPFISSNFNLIPEEHFNKLKKLIFISTLPQLYSEQEKKVKYFQYLVSLSGKYRFALTILIDDSLHGKVYIRKCGNDYKTIITSANFTQKGLRSNNELGVCFDNENIALDIWQSLTTSAKVRELTVAQINDYANIIKSNPITPIKKEQQAYEFPLPIPSVPLTQQIAVGYWLKPLGTSNNPIRDDELFDQPFKNITFKNNPDKIHQGDILICYAAGRRIIVGIYRIADGIISPSPSKRWPYSMKCENLYPYFGADWAKRGIHLGQIKNDIIAHSNFTITPDGLNDYSHVRRTDKMAVTPEYAAFVMQKIGKEDQQLASELMTDFQL